MSAGGLGFQACGIWAFEGFEVGSCVCRDTLGLLGGPLYL